MTKVKDTHSDYVIIPVYSNSGYAIAFNCMFIRTLPVLYSSSTSATPPPPPTTTTTTIYSSYTSLTFRCGSICTGT
jgi:hypothetical protein